MPYKRRKSHNVRNALIAVLLLAVVVGVVVVSREMYPGGQVGASPPTYSGVWGSSTKADTNCTFSTLWTGAAGLSGYVFGTNNTGGFVNDTWTPFSAFVSQTSAYANVTKTVENTFNDVVTWRFWCNDSGNRWNAIPLQSFYVDSDTVFIETSMGYMTVELYADMPITTGNFKSLVRTGAYNGTLFNRVARNFVIQGGDVSNVPTFPDELPNLHSNVRGSLAMAKSASGMSVVPNSAASQFFINLNDTNAASLDSDFSVFGHVIQGMEVADAIGQVATNPANDGKPILDVNIIRIIFVR